MRLVAISAAVLLGALCPNRAHAHGGFWRAHDILFAPDDARRIVLRSDVWGMVVSEDGGANWQWLCAEAFGRMSTNARRISVALAPGRVLVASLGEGMWTSTSDLCEWTTLPEFEGLLVRDVRAVSPDGTRLYALATESANGTVTTTLWESIDAGAGWKRRGPPLPVGFAGNHLGLTASDPTRVYAAGADAGAGALARSDDAGLSWRLRDVPVNAAFWEARIHGIDPGDPDQIYFWVDAFTLGGGQFSPDTILFSDNAGDSWSTLFEGTSDMPGLAFSPDGTQVRLGGIDDGMWAARTAEVATKGKHAFSKVFDDAIYGLTWTDTGLYAGGNDYTTSNPFSVGRSSDGSETFASWMSVCDVQPRVCDADTRVGQLCPSKYSDMGLGAGGFKEDFVVTPRCFGSVGGADAGDAAAPSPDARDASATAFDAATGTSSSTRGGCDCSSAGSDQGGAAGWPVVFALLGVARRRFRWRPC